MIIEKSSKEPECRQLVKKLASNDKKTRDSAVISLSHFLSLKKQLDYSELLKLWKGLFYCMWMSDRSFTQQKLANDLADLVSKCSIDNALLFLNAFWETICREWISIDVLRLNKFYLLIRKYIEQGFRVCMASSWSQEVLKKYIFILKSIPLNPMNPKIPNSIRYHVSDVYLDELYKVSSEKIQIQNFPIQIFLEPFVYLFKKTSDKHVRKRVLENVFQDKRIELWLNKNGDDYGSNFKMLDINDDIS
ncbi:hypothetical protein PMAC_002773 [Pneumocystis sp. 'macacae']|nr:hypothetical protein PMAC_002773 [Pneumocystis sp. 'macacae']